MHYAQGMFTTRIRCRAVCAMAGEAARQRLRKGFQVTASKKEVPVSVSFFRTVFGGKNIPYTLNKQSGGVNFVKKRIFPRFCVPGRRKCAPRGHFALQRKRFSHGKRRPARNENTAQKTSQRRSSRGGWHATSPKAALRRHAASFPQKPRSKENALKCVKMIFRRILAHLHSAEKCGIFASQDRDIPRGMSLYFCLY